MATVLLAAPIVGCSGQIGGPADAPAGTGTGSPTTQAANPAKPDDLVTQGRSSALRRLTRQELESTIRDVFGISGVATGALQADVFAPYDTDVTTKAPSAVFVEGMENIAFDIAKQVSADPAFVSRWATCTPASPADGACLTALVETLGERLLRRPLNSAEVTATVEPALGFATERADFAVGVRSAVQALLLHPEFPHRVEIGVAEEGRRRLSNYELVTRLSYLIWSSAPDEDLLARAAGEPLSADDLAGLAERMLTDARASNQIMRFHRLWLGYEGLNVPQQLRETLLQETEALLYKVVLDGAGRHSELFTWPETYVDQTLAQHYGIAGASVGQTADWVTYSSPERAGLLAHGSLLSLGARGTDPDATSPTSRGRFISERLLCLEVPDPPPDANADSPPEVGPSDCKLAAYEAHRARGSSCFGCHELMDPIGFGLERFDGLGRYRTTEADKPHCPIDGKGSVSGVGSFHGIAELSQLLLEQQRLQRCVVSQYFHYAMGRKPSPADQGIISRVHSEFSDAGEDFRQLIVQLVGDPTFGYRTATAAPGDNGGD